MHPCALHFRYSRYTPALASPPFRCTLCHTSRVLYPVCPASVFRGAFKLPSDNALPSMHFTPFFKRGVLIFWVNLKNFSFIQGLKTVFRSVCVTYFQPTLSRSIRPFPAGQQEAVAVCPALPGTTQEQTRHGSGTGYLHPIVRCQLHGYTSLLVLAHQLGL